MGWIPMTLILLASLGTFAWIANRRWRLMFLNQDRVNRFDRVGDRIRSVVRFALVQERMRRYPIAGFAHLLIFLGFGVLLLRSLVLIGRGYDADFDLWILGEGTVLGNAYAFIKDVFVLLVLAARACSSTTAPWPASGE